MYEYKGRLMNARVNAFYIPGLISTLSITASMFLDVAIVGQMLGPVAMGAASLSLPLTMVFNMVYMLFGTGGEVLVSAAKGAGDKAEADKLFSLTIYTIVTLGVLCMILGLWSGDSVAQALSRGDRDMEPLLVQYIHIMFFSAPLMIGVTGLSYFVKVDALPKLAAGIMVFTNVVNLTTKVLYMGPLQMGIAGAAYGTITGFVAGFLLVVPYLFLRKNRTLSFVPLAVKDFSRLGNIIVTGLPPALGQGLGAVSAFCTNTVILDIGGRSGIIINTVCHSIAIFISSFRYAATSTMVPIVGALFGERDWWSMYQVAMRITKLVMGCVAVCVGLIEVFPAVLLSFFGVQDAEVMKIGIPALRIYAIGLLIVSFNYILMTYMQVTARKLFSIAISAGSEIFSIIFVYLFGYGLGNIGLWSYSIAAYLLLLFLIVATTKYIGRTSNGKYHGLFIHEVQPAYVHGNSIYATREDVEKYTVMIEEFFAGHQIAPPVLADLKELLYQTILEIVEKEKNPKKTIDIMAVLYDGSIRIRLRDDGRIPAVEKLNKDERVGRLSVMGYNNTYIKIPAL